MRTVMRIIGIAALAASAGTLAQAQEAEPKAGQRLETVLDGLADEPRDAAAAPTREDDAQPAAEAPAAADEGQPAAQEAEPERSLTDAERRQALGQALERGRLLAVTARAGMLASRDMLSRISDPDEAGIRGWVAEAEGNATAVTFYADAEAGPVAAYRARILGGRVVGRDIFAQDERPALRGTAARMIAARNATDPLDHRACPADAAFNVVVLPPAAAGADILVYQMSPPLREDRFPLGGHYRSTIAADGSVSEAVPLAAGCRDAVVPDVPEGQRAQPLEVTHAGPVPTEVHVFLSLTASRPVLVAARGTSWLVTGNGIAEFRR